MRNTHFFPSNIEKLKKNVKMFYSCVIVMFLCIIQYFANNFRWMPLTGLPIYPEGLAPLIPSKPVKCFPFRIVHCGELAASAGTDSCDVKQNKPETKPCKFQLDVSFVLRHQCQCLAEGPRQESVLMFRRYFKTFTC